MRVRLEDDPFIDHIEIDIVPRFKTSGMSGDEWRWSVRCAAYRKGRLVKERFVGDMRYAQAMMATGDWWNEDEDIPNPKVADDLCDQPGCSEPWTVKYRMTNRGCGRCGNRERYSGGDLFPYERVFCERHAHRGDSNLDDMDDNYQPVDGGMSPHEHVPNPADESPSVFGGVIGIKEP